MVVDRVTAAVLLVLWTRKAAIVQDVLAGLTEISRPTLRPALHRMLTAGLIAKPLGPRSGYVITAAGVERLLDIPPDLLNRWRLFDSR